MSEALFPSGGKALSGLVSRANQRHFKRFDVNPPAAPIKSYNPVHQGKNCVVATQPNIFAGQKFRSALPDNDISGHHLLAPKFFNAQAFADAVSPVLNTALTLLMRHSSVSSPLKVLLVDRLDLDPGKLTPVTHGPVVSLAAPIF